MSTPEKSMISLAEAQALVAFLEQEDGHSANELLRDVVAQHERELFQNLGQITRELHDSLVEFQMDERFEQLATDEMPDVRNRLNYVLDKTQESANRTMDAVEDCLPVAQNIQDTLGQVHPLWQALMRREIELSQFKSLCHQLNDFIQVIDKDSTQLKTQLNVILMAQDFQDLTGQVIQRVIALVQEVEQRLVILLETYGTTEKSGHASSKKNISHAEPEGPIINPKEREDVVCGQDDVDDLLSSLGF